MAALYQFPSFTPLASRKFLLSSPPQLPNIQSYCCSRISASSSKEPRGSRKAKRDAEICNEIRKFLSSVGLPENHMPSVKELSQNGRQDLANIVKRRGYKYIRQLLDESNMTNSNGSCMGTGESGQLEELSVSEGQNENQEVLSNDVSSAECIQEAGFNISMVTSEQLVLNNSSSFVSEPTTLTLQEKVAKFIEHGELETLEDCGLETGHAVEAEWNNESEHASGDPHNSSGDEALHETSPSSLQKVEPPAFGNSSPRNTYLLPEEQTSDNKDLDFEAQELENQAEIERLKFLLHQKEFELTQLKQQIEKEKLSLSALQTGAEVEISTAEKLISEKEIQLLAAEESLSDLKEVEILYSGQGEIVELAGSFNGWHNTIRMDLQPHIESRTSQLWRAVLWLYPGVYEIKFIVDGQWKIDPQRESVTRNNLQNNVLRVDQ